MENATLAAAAEKRRERDGKGRSVGSSHPHQVIIRHAEPAISHPNYPIPATAATTAAQKHNKQTEHSLCFPVPFPFSICFLQLHHFPFHIFTPPPSSISFHSRLVLSPSTFTLPRPHGGRSGTLTPPSLLSPPRTCWPGPWAGVVENSRQPVAAAVVVGAER